MAAVAVLVSVLAPEIARDAHALIVATRAEDVCPSDADPCTITEPIRIVDGATLDFGVRAVEIEAGARFEIGSGSAIVRCGDFTTRVAGALAVDAAGSGTGVLGGTFELEARRRCGDSLVPCKRDSDCGRGACSLGGGRVLIDGRVAAGGAAAGFLRIEGAGNVSVLGAIDASSTDADEDGGSVLITSGTGSVRVSGALAARSGRSGAGGELQVRAALDVLLEGEVDLSGGEFGGGLLDVDADRDVLISAAVHASATRLDGEGGEIKVRAGRALRLSGAVVLETDGGRASDFAGDGGSQSYGAGEDVVIASDVVLRANGARPDGIGGSLSVSSGADLTMSGRIEARALGLGAGAGAKVELEACSLRVASNAWIETAGPQAANKLTAHERLAVETGAQLLSSTNGTNLLRYRDPGAPPVVEGNVFPAATLLLDPTLTPCEGSTSTTLPATTTTTTTSSTVTTTTLPIPAGCGDGIVAPGEQCEPRPGPWRPGRACRPNCTAVACGDPDDSGRLTASDALLMLRAAVGLLACDACVCDVDTTGPDIRVGDALRVLRIAVGVPLEMICPPCA